MFLAVLITGGYGRGDWVSSAEIYLPSGKTSCSLPELTEERAWHTQDGPWACGGRGIDTCEKWSEGSWTRSQGRLSVYRGDHVSWASVSGVYLMGTYYKYKNGKETTELVKEDGEVKEGFPLKVPTE